MSILRIIKEMQIKTTKDDILLIKLAKNRKTILVDGQRGWAVVRPSGLHSGAAKQHSLSGKWIIIMYKEL